MVDSQDIPVYCEGGIVYIHVKVDLVVDSQDILVYCEGGIVQSCRLVLACLSPLLRSILLQAEEPSIILPGVQVVHEVQVDYGG